MGTIVGVSLFGEITCLNGLDEQHNFKNFFNSLFTLFCIMTGSPWLHIHWGITEPGPECNKPNDIQPPFSLVGICYIVSYIFITVLIMMELYTAVIIEQYGELSSKKALLFQSIRRWTTEWEMIDYKARGT